MSFDIRSITSSDYKPDASLKSDRLTQRSWPFNDGLEEMLKNMGLAIYQSSDIQAPYFRRNTIYMPLSGHYESTSNYYHALLREATKYMNAALAQDIDLVKAEDAYRKEAKAEPDKLAIFDGVEKHGNAFFTQESFNQLCASGAPESLKRFAKATEHIALAGTKQELQCEIVALNVLEHVGIQLDKRDMDYAGRIGNTAEKIHQSFVQTVYKTAEGHALAGQIDALQEILKEQYAKATQTKYARSTPLDGVTIELEAQAEEAKVVKNAYAKGVAETIKVSGLSNDEAKKAFRDKHPELAKRRDEIVSRETRQEVIQRQSKAHKQPLSRQRKF